MHERAAGAPAARCRRVVTATAGLFSVECNAINETRWGVRPGPQTSGWGCSGGRCSSCAPAAGHAVSAPPISSTTSGREFEPAQPSSSTTAVCVAIEACPGVSRCLQPPCKHISFAMAATLSQRAPTATVQRNVAPSACGLAARPALRGLGPAPLPAAARRAPPPMAAKAAAQAAEAVFEVGLAVCKGQGRPGPCPCCLASRPACSPVLPLTAVPPLHRCILPLAPSWRGITPAWPSH